jgi:hypothetical protein
MGFRLLFQIQAAIAKSSIIHEIGLLFIEKPRERRKAPSPATTSSRGAWAVNPAAAARIMAPSGQAYAACRTHKHHTRTIPPGFRNIFILPTEKTIFARYHLQFNPSIRDLFHRLRESVPAFYLELTDEFQRL